MLSSIRSQEVASKTMEEFERRKAAAMASMASTEPDRSPKGSLDAPIIPLLTSLNLHPSFFTTSSCSGRISILSQPITTTTTTIKKKAKGGSWLYITHDPADPDLVTDLLFTKAHHSSTHDAELTFRFEPFIVAVECRDVASAQSLVSTAISCGFRESGITSAHKRVIVAIRCSIRLEVPLGTGKAVMVSPEYVGYLVRIANEKMESNRSRTERFLRVFLETQFTRSEILSCKQVMNEKNNEVVVVGGEDQGDCFDGSSNEVSVDLIQFGAGECGSEEANSNTHLGLEDQQCSISVVKMVVVGEPVEKIFLWGHSVSILDDKLHSKLVIFGGFGGIGRHSRRNDTLVLDTQCGLLEAINVEGSPSPRLGHTSSVIGECVFIIGGRGDPLTILNDVWAFNVAKNKWRLVECNGSLFPSRHRHAAAVVGSKIFVFGGLNNEKIFSSMHILDTEDSQWSEVPVQGEWPCARHSHALVSKGSQLFMFGGYDGEKALDELYTFDVNKHLWKKEKTIGRPPCARFSHSMFVYKNYLGIIGGCPVTKHYHELALLDLQTSVWKHMILDSAGEDLFVRSIANVVGDDLLMIGGGAACYAFGTKFSEPMKMNLLPLASTDGSSMLEKHRIEHAEVGRYQNNANILGPSNSAKTMTRNSKLNHGAEMLGENLESHFGSKFWVLQLERKNVKMGKDILKKFGWLDLGRKVYSCENEICFSLPVTGKFYAIFQKHELDQKLAFDGRDGPPRLPVTAEKLSIDNISCQTALNYLFSLGGSLVRDEVAHVRKTLKSPQKIMTEAISSLIKGRGLPMQLLEQIPTRWERLGDIVVLPVTSFKDPIWDSIGTELWPTVAKALGTRRLARQGRIAPTGTRDSTLEILVGDNGWVHHRENGITYSFDTTKCMFSWGNYSEKVRMARLDCRDEVIVDLFAGIGYFVLPFLVGAKAKLVYACEWNPHAVDALRHNVQANSVAERCIILEGDNRVMAPEGVADRVCLGLLPSSKDSWVTAVRALRVEGGTLHVHENVKDSEEPMWSEHVAKSIHDIAISEGLSWEVWIEHVERVKWYAPHIRHLVVDVRCKQLGS